MIGSPDFLGLKKMTPSFTPFSGMKGSPSFFSSSMPMSLSPHGSTSETAVPIPVTSLEDIMTSSFLPTPSRPTNNRQMPPDSPVIDISGKNVPHGHSPPQQSRHNRNYWDRENAPEFHPSYTPSHYGRTWHSQDISTPFSNSRAGSEMRNLVTGSGRTRAKNPGSDQNNSRHQQANDLSLHHIASSCSFDFGSPLMHKP